MVKGLCKYHQYKYADLRRTLEIGLEKSYVDATQIDLMNVITGEYRETLRLPAPKKPRREAGKKYFYAYVNGHLQQTF